MTLVEVTETEVSLRPDPTRVIVRFFVPGREDVGPGESRAAPVIDRILRLDECDIELAVDDLDKRFAHRHRDLHGLFSSHASMITSRLDPDVEVSAARRLFLGASFTHEYAIEGAALCNPSAVLHPVQPGGDTRFVLSVRGIGEGHISSIGFRTGRVTAGGEVTIDPPGAYPETAGARPGHHHRAVFHAKLAELGDDRENAAYVLDRVPDVFDDADLERAIDSLAADGATRRRTAATIANLRDLARSSYVATFADETEVSERVLWPHSPAERHGMEDARFVRFVDDAGAATWFATYTAFDGTHIGQHVLHTNDFKTFTASPMAGVAAAGKGLALFPRKVRGRFAALSRADRETNSITYSDDMRCWDASTLIQVPERPWEILQLGNCGSPIETDAGWLVLTHGVGPMRTYSLAAILLDLDEPERVIATSDGPILSPDADHRDGYVPNVVYSCGGFAHGDVLVLPYGVADQMISVATLSISQLLGSLRPTG
ncbi:MAG: glycosidase, -protein [Ilumatobacteraceae bacterium]|nr:glycosidase, -protein [Ilumatobacteraceae bacterium]